MLNIVCVKQGTKYGPEYVNILFDMVRRNLLEGTEGRFICFTDDPSGLSLGVQVEPLPAYVKGWWSKLYLFNTGTFQKGDRVIYFDLDVVITGALDELVKYDGDFAILREFYTPDGWQSSVMALRAGYGREVWERWIGEGMPDLAGGDQEWIEQVLGKADILQDLYPGYFYSYKLHLNHKTPPRGSRVIVFHGEPKPDNCGDEWVEMVWKVGGGTAAELELVCNTNDENLKRNIIRSCKLETPWLLKQEPHDGHAVIVGGGPSLIKDLDEIRWRQSLGQKIFATNNAYAFLQKHGIGADAHVMLDARAENAAFVPTFTLEGHKYPELYYASQCHPDVFAAADLSYVTLWHSHNEVLDSALWNPDGRDELLINGGTTVGLSSMAVAYALGYRKIHCYGMDSSFAESTHHAYTQALNDNDRKIEVVCHGRKFVSAPWMVAQADQFQTLAYELANDDCEITVHGSGLLPWLARNLALSLSQAPAIMEIDGLYWPASDAVCRNYTLLTAQEMGRFIELCQNRHTAILAGGNVGVWPKEAAKHFERVITFEPDALNFQCLKLNCTEENIEAHNAALGDKPGRKGLARQFDNCGAHTITEGDEFDVVAIDSLELDACDLIQLDIEGDELFALKGAEKTIRKFKPVICVELKALGKGFGVNDAEVVKWLEERGYGRKRKLGRDVVFINEEREVLCNTAQLMDMSPI